MSKAAAVVLAAGQGTRMHSRMAKVLHPIAGRTMIEHVLYALQAGGVGRILVVIGYQGEEVQNHLRDRWPGIEFVVQEQRLGTGHAVGICREALGDFGGPLLVTCGDTPLFRGETYQALLQEHNRCQFQVSVMTADKAEPQGYGRIIRNADGGITAIIEHKDATAEQRAITEVNAGTYCFDSAALFSCLEQLTCENAQGEYYLTDVIGLAASAGMPVGGCLLPDANEIQGVNNRVHLAEVEAVIRERVRQYWMCQGVTMLDPNATYIDVDCQLGCDTVLYPQVLLESRSTIGENCTIGPNVRLTNSSLGSDVVVQNAVLDSAAVADESIVGPFAYLRPGTTIGPGCRIGDFVEVKNTTVGAGAKIPHHSYIGDADVGERVNVGCGTITCNYDGKAKHRTVIEDDSFIGSNANLVAPITVGRGAFVAAGSTITKDVPADALAIARQRQSNKEGWCRRKSKNSDSAAEQKNSER